MNRRLILLITLVLGCLLLASAQDDGKVTAKGVIIDAKTGEPVAFANMGLLGTVAGVASDIDGKFELIIPYRYVTYKVKISAVGYAPLEMKFYEIKDKPDLVIKLMPVSYDMKAVDVYGELLVYKKMLQNVVSNIHKNYIATPYNYEGYFKCVTNADGIDKVKEATVTIYDAKGYHRGDVASAFSELNYKFNEVRRNQPTHSVLDGLTCLDDILTADVVRNTRNVLDIMNSRDYKLKSKGKILYEGDSVQIISYTAKNPSISTAGDPSVRSYSGEIYVNQKNFAVLKNIVQITARNFNSLGRNLVAINEKPKEDVNMTITTTYKKVKSVYILSGVKIDYAYKEEGKELKGLMEYVTTRVKIDNPTVITGRTYYEDIKTNEDFWNRYTVYFEE